MKFRNNSKIYFKIRLAITLPGAVEKVLFNRRVAK